MNIELADKFLSSIAHERDQDIEATSQLLKLLPLPKLVKAGQAINNLYLENIRTGLAGKIYLELGPYQAVDDEISKGSIKVGDVVAVKPSATSKGKSKAKTKSSKAEENGDSDRGADDLEITGVVFKITDKQCSITIDEAQEQDAMKLYSYSKLYLLKTVNTITYKRMESTMRKLKEFEGLPDNRIIEYLLNARQFIRQEPSNKITFHNDQLNESQKDAIKFALANDISIIHGPPGTGKTYTLVELILQLVEKGQRVLVCGPSNISVDTILERLAKVLPGNLLLRIGHPARLLEANLSHSLDILSKSGDSGAIVRDIYRDIDKTIASIKKVRKPDARREGWKEVKELRKELRQRERKVVNDLILEAKVVVATLHGSSSRELCGIYNQVPKLFDTLIIDEVSQSLEPQCWIPLISHYKSDFTKLVLAGDNKQLPPTIKTEDNDKVKVTLGTTLFDRLVKNYGDQFKLLLNVQYRMNEQIMEFPSKQMYGGKLIADASVANNVLSDLPGVDSNDDTLPPLIWYDTQGDDFLEQADNEDGIVSSKFNENEVLLVKDHIIKLIESNVPQDAIGVISPYSAQTSLLKSLIQEQYPLIEISTVDGFQGREKEVIVLSLVRSNDKMEVGFLRDDRRLNVAISRPKKQLCVIGNMEVLERSGVKFLKNWAEWSSENSDLRYPDISELL
ncbi:hypothetical protein Kpol_1057p6 [Vanderwaltozyma polyspora DSM 70294]|uniref:DNA helicase n=1 Tax=Vanderwaltozyma polyspora (strain ATCC 22028 / DSM 70294 / BCRC 21397 / CBS 2163 / NBRC 10782 / NRRL Y-8283 / UCD 57-17) TaxID=436907 RepID=A7TPH4_VANPO|nr:uncharacterized protein Kpol_1057p6 [Vanderwaltozyma polyspora DSM 70294]EDO15818.1 hypothetical protein Kpol_1057p6 [Vanderwaltozyma polyspora DSM 70294]